MVDRASRAGPGTGVGWLWGGLLRWRRASGEWVKVKHSAVFQVPGNVTKLCFSR